MSYVSPIECEDNLTALDILKKIIKEDSDGNYYVGVHEIDES